MSVHNNPLMSSQLCGVVSRIGLYGPGSIPTLRKVSGRILAQNAESVNFFSFN